jgi:phage terminase large subunit
MQLAVILALEDPGCVITISRKTLPALKATAYRDFLDVLRVNDIYDEKNHNKTDLTFKIGNSEVEFISVDQPQKIRGRKRKYLFMNEANEFTSEDFKQLNMRTTGRIYMDFNPSDTFHWIYDDILTRPDVTFIKSTYRDNPFLEKQIIHEIEMYQEADPNYWRIYGLGERGVPQTTVYTHWQLCDSLPEGGELIYGQDFGYNHPAATIRVVLKDNDIYVQEAVYQSHLKDPELIDLVKEAVGPKEYVYCDTEDPQAIAGFKLAGINAKNANKEKGSVLAGIREIQKRRLFITKDSPNLLKEIKAYSWKTKGEQTIDEPVKLNDDAMDAMRYAVYTHTKRKKPGIYV